MKNKKTINQIEPWYDSNEIKAVTNYLKSGGWITEFSKTRELEQLISSYVGSKYCVMVPNCSLALWTMLKVLNISYNDEVIVPDFTMVSTANAVIFSGAKPICVDIDRENFCLDLEKTRKAINNKTKAIILVTVNGRSAKMELFVKLAKEKNLYLLEDAAQSFGSTYKNKHLGTFGIMGCYSFSMPKIITMGQGGAIVTDNKELYEKLSKFKDSGRLSGGSDHYEDLGFNLKFNDLLAVFGIEQMKKISLRIKRKRKIYEYYKNKLSSIKEIEFIQTDLMQTSPWFIDVLVPNPDSLLSYLENNNICTRRFYPSLHQLSFLNITSGNFPNTAYVSNHGLWLPSTSNLTDRQLDYICSKIISYYG